MTTLYEKYPAVWESLARQGKPSIGEVAKRFSCPIKMSQVFDSPGIVRHWIAGRNGASMPSERAARIWLASQQGNNPAPSPAPVVVQQAPAHKASDDMALYLVICPASKARQVERICAVMDWEAEKIGG